MAVASPLDTTDQPVAATAADRALYERLAAPFDETFKDRRGGFEFDYVTGEQVISRLNEIFGFSWSFKVIDKGYNEEADELWVQGRITLYQMAGQGRSLDISRDQFGSQKVKRSKANQNPLDIGFDWKGATTDALKKCATLFGVGLYLSRKESQLRTSSQDDTEAFGQAHQQRAAEDRPAASRPATQQQRAPAQNQNAEKVTGLVCRDCGEPLQETKFKDGTVWTPAQLAAYGNRKHGRPLCMTHYREANDAVRRAQSLEAVPF